MNIWTVNVRAGILVIFFYCNPDEDSGEKIMFFDSQTQENLDKNSSKDRVLNIDLESFYS